MTMSAEPPDTLTSKPSAESSSKFDPFHPDMPQIPGDIFADPPLPLQYRLDAGGPTVWSVGKDGVDDHAQAAKEKDFVFGAAAPPPPPPPPPPMRPPLTTRPASRLPATGFAPTGGPG